MICAMKISMTKWAAGLIVSVAAMAMLGGCGAFFPTKAAERAADRVLDDVLRNKDRPVEKPADVAGKIESKKT